MSSRIRKPKQKLNILVDLEDLGQHNVCYSLDDRFCAVYPSDEEQWKILLSKTASKSIASAVKTQHNLLGEPIVLFQRTLVAPDYMSCAPLEQQFI